MLCKVYHGILCALYTSVPKTHILVKKTHKKLLLLTNENILYVTCECILCMSFLSKFIRKH